MHACGWHDRKKSCTLSDDQRYSTISSSVKDEKVNFLEVCLFRYESPILYETQSSWRHHELMVEEGQGQGSPFYQNTDRSSTFVADTHTRTTKSKKYSITGDHSK